MEKWQIENSENSKILEISLRVFLHYKKNRKIGLKKTRKKISEISKFLTEPYFNIHSLCNFQSIEF